MLAEHLSRYLARIRQTTPLPARIVLWDGTEIPLGEPTPVTIRLRNRRAITRLLKPRLDSIGDAYVSGAIDIEGPLEEAIRVATSLAQTQTNANANRSQLGRLPAWARQHTRSADRQAISYHYDVSNAFYEQFLDEQMVYSCAYYAHDGMNLKAAQQAKLDLICRKLRLSSDHHLLDIGCGWGAMAIYAAQHYGARVTGVTLSENQLELATRRVHDAGLNDRIELRLQDYRDIPETDYFDRIVSIGMFEHVGLKHLAEYFLKIMHMAKPGAIVMNHGITAADPDSAATPNGAGEFIGKYVFPNGELPHVSLAIKELSRSGLELVDAESLRRHYGKTLWAWSDRFEQALPQLQQLANDQTVRIWRAYLAGCAYAFDNGWINIYQLLAAKPVAGDSQQQIMQPMTRDYIYRNPN
ncbi:MAG: cyclopropane-fatty-acyl-phospholipid synthase family protein [Burkholderiaceae bacterium]